MIIDIIVAVALVMAVIKGFQKGLIVALFSVLAFVAGLAAALKLSAVVAAWLQQSTNIGAKWLPVVSFVLVFIAVALLVRLGAKLIENAVEFAFLGWINKTGGILLYAVLYIIIISIFLFYAQQLKLFSQSSIDASVTWKWITPRGPKVIEGLGVIIPWFKDMFEDLQHFFSAVNEKISH
ncbi:MAG: CvpA family protein [Chitinophagaceae bacterium]|nr:CvpA family protein [Chitinophagaceae bacterium]